MSDNNNIYRLECDDPGDECWEIYTLRGKNFLRTDIIIKQFVFRSESASWAWCFND